MILVVLCLQRGLFSLSLEREVEEMVNDLMKKERWTKYHTLSVLRSKFESEERYQEVQYVNKLMEKEEEIEQKDKKKNNTQLQEDY
jgi:hypothetical protein